MLSGQASGDVRGRTEGLKFPEGKGRCHRDGHSCLLPCCETKGQRWARGRVFDAGAALVAEAVPVFGMIVRVVSGALDWHT